MTSKQAASKQHSPAREGCNQWKTILTVYGEKTSDAVHNRQVHIQRVELPMCTFSHIHQPNTAPELSHKNLIKKWRIFEKPQKILFAIPFVKNALLYFIITQKQQKNCFHKPFPEKFIRNKKKWKGCGI